MYRSSSGSRVSEELFANLPTSTEVEQSRQQLPTYNPFSDAAKKERSRIRSAENAIHIIPLVLVCCAVVLWFFSNLGSLFKFLKTLGIIRSEEAKKKFS